MLTQLLSHLPSIGSLPEVAKLYYELRRPRVERCRAVTRTQGPAMTLPDGPEQERRDRYLRTPPHLRKEVDPTFQNPFGNFEFQGWFNSFDATKEVSWNGPVLTEPSFSHEKVSRKS